MGGVTLTEDDVSATVASVAVEIETLDNSSSKSDFSGTSGVVADSGPSHGSIGFRVSVMHSAGAVGTIKSIYNYYELGSDKT